jgi:hypothetical protein
VVSRSAAIERRSVSEMCCAVASSRVDLLGRQPVVAPAMRRDQRAVHDQVGIAPDRRGEMRVVRSARPKWPKFSGL